MISPVSSVEQPFQTLEISKSQEIAAPIEIVFQAVLDQLGPASEMPDGAAFPMTLEAWPGGRWFRDLGNNAGHLWGHVQVIKPPFLLEICGPMFMSYPAVNHFQYRLTAQDSGTLVQCTHRGMGLFQQEHLAGVQEGWDVELSIIKKHAERKAAEVAAPPAVQ